MVEQFTDTHESVNKAIDASAYAFWNALDPHIQNSILANEIHGLTETVTTLSTLFGKERLEVFLADKRLNRAA